MIEEPTQNKMMTNPPAKKEYHFAATTEHFAEVVYAATIQEAEETYHRVKRLINTPPEAISPVEPVEQSTPAPVEEPEEKEV